jgi:hypothetical protein
MARLPCFTYFDIFSVGRSIFYGVYNGASSSTERRPSDPSHSTRSQLPLAPAVVGHLVALQKLIFNYLYPSLFHMFV